APAKVNLYLRITGRRPDGYHLLDSVMVPVSLYDEIEITIENQTESARKTETGKENQTETGKGILPHITVTCDDPTLPTDKTNLAYKAAALFCKEAGISAKITIDLHKRIPFGAGLGGGSSDAAAVLKGLNTLCLEPFSEQRLCALGVRLGA